VYDLASQVILLRRKEVAMEFLIKLDAMIADEGPS
jgi:hypothetical protein